MKVLNGKEKTSKVVPDHICAHRLDLSNDIKHLLPMDILHYKIYILFVMKRLHIAHYVGEYDLLEDSFLSNNSLFHLLLLNVLLTKGLNCK
jgi:hypothetical protein